MKFEYPYLLYLLWLTPLIVIFFFFAYKHKISLLKKFCEMDICFKIIEDMSLFRKKIRYLLLTLIFIMIILAMSGPKWGFVWEDIRRKGVDIYFAIDVSESMLAEDMSPNRIERAKRELIDFMNIVQGDRVGLVVFAGKSFVQCPLTLDYNAIQMFIDDISTYSVPVKGTSIANAIRTCIDAFNRSAESSSKAIILITDGEDHLGDVIAAANEAKNQGVVIYAIGLGQPAGAKLPGPGGTLRHFGEEVISKPNFKQLKEITNLTGGIYAHSVTGNLDIENIYLRGIKRALKEQELKTSREKRWFERFQWPLSLAVILVIFEFFMRDKRNSSRRKNNNKVETK